MDNKQLAGPLTAEDDLTEQLRADGQAYFAAAHPNPQRQSCPVTARLGEAARNNQPPAEELLAHLFSCSECFRQYRRQKTERATAKRATLPAAPAPQPTRPARRYLWAVMAGLAVACGLAVLVWQMRSPAGQGQIAQANRRDTTRSVTRPPAEMSLTDLLDAAGGRLAFNATGATRLQVTFDPADNNAAAAARSLTLNGQTAQVIAPDRSSVTLEFAGATPFKAGDRLCFTYGPKNHCVTLQIADK